MSRFRALLIHPSVKSSGLLTCNLMEVCIAVFSGAGPIGGSVSEVSLRRCRECGGQARPQPTTHAELLEYLLDTEGGEMNFEVARTRPMLTDDLFAYLKETIRAHAACAV